MIWRASSKSPGSPSGNELLVSADFAYEQVEVGKFFDVPDESGKTELLDGHHIPPAAEHSRGRLSKKEIFLRRTTSQLFLEG